MKKKSVLLIYIICTYQTFVHCQYMVHILTIGSNGEKKNNTLFKAPGELLKSVLLRDTSTWSVEEPKIELENVQDSQTAPVSHDPNDTCGLA